MGLVGRAALVGAGLAGMVVFGSGAATAAPWGSAGTADVGIERAHGDGLNACAVRVTNHGDQAARDVTVQVFPGRWPYEFGTLDPGESAVAAAFDCGFSPILLHVVTTSNGDGNWADNALYFEV